MFALKFSPLSRQDIADIFNYTLEHWGERAFREYKLKLNKAFAAIAQNPDIGLKKRKWLVYKAERHKIFYRVEGAKIHIIRILHERMNPDKPLS